MNSIEIIALVTLMTLYLGAAGWFAVRLARKRQRSPWLWPVLSALTGGLAILVLLLLGNASDERSGVRKITLNLLRFAALPVIALVALVGKNADTSLKAGAHGARDGVEAARLVETFAKTSAVSPLPPAMMETLAKHGAQARPMTTYEEIAEVIETVEDLHIRDIAEWYGNLRDAFSSDPPTFDDQAFRLGRARKPEQEKDALDYATLPKADGTTLLIQESSFTTFVGAAPAASPESLVPEGTNGKFWLRLVDEAPRTRPPGAVDAIRLLEDGGVAVIRAGHAFKDGPRVCFFAERERLLLDRRNLPDASHLLDAFRHARDRQRIGATCTGYDRDASGKLTTRTFAPGARVFIYSRAKETEPPRLQVLMNPWATIGARLAGPD